MHHQTVLALSVLGATCPSMGGGRHRVRPRLPGRWGSSRGSQEEPQCRKTGALDAHRPGRAALPVEKLRRPRLNREDPAGFAHPGHCPGRGGPFAKHDLDPDEQLAANGAQLDELVKVSEAAPLFEEKGCRALNSALHMAAITRTTHDVQTRDFVRKRRAEGRQDRQRDPPLHQTPSGPPCVQDPGCPHSGE